MPRPFRMATSDITVRLHRTQATDLLLDPVFDVPIQASEDQFVTDGVVLRAQPRYQRNRDQQANMAGDNNYSWAWFDVSAHEIARKGITDPFTLKNALITQISRLHGTDPEKYIVTEVRPRGHLRHGPVLFQLFVDKLQDQQGVV